MTCSDTTDVQEAIILVDYDDGSFEVTCEFAVGSRARGCFLELIGLNETYSKHILRESDYARHSAHLMLPLEGLAFFVYDWEEDGSIGNVSVTIRNDTGKCGKVALFMHSMQC